MSLRFAHPIVKSVDVTFRKAMNVPTAQLAEGLDFIQQAFIEQLLCPTLLDI